ncbi:Short-chain dehydrogenase [Sphingobium faniae]|nr:Short-chain dehydrogenase [Sphingobium faniae]
MSNDGGFGFDHESTSGEVLRGKDLKGIRALVTGASSGIGVETARALAAHGAELVLAVRDVTAGKTVAQDIARTTGSCPQVEALDLGSLQSVRALAERLGGAPLHLLIANAGIMACPQGRTEDGLERQIGINHFGHFALTLALTPNLLAEGPARVIMLSSAAHVLAGVDCDDLHFDRRSYDKWIAYAQSKTANALFAMEYDRRMSPHGISAWSVMPGRIQTGLARHITQDDLKGMAPGPKARPPKSVEQGAATTLWAATEARLEGQGGLYLEDCAIAPRWTPDVGARIGVADHARDPVAAERLWTISEHVVGMTLP